MRRNRDLPAISQRLRTTLFGQSEELRCFKLDRKMHVSVLIYFSEM